MPAVVGMPVSKNTANTTMEARAQSISSTSKTMTSMPMLPICVSQQVSELPSSGGNPRSSLRLVSYRPMARKGPMSRQPLAMAMLYSGLARNTQPMSRAMAQKHRP